MKTALVVDDHPITHLGAARLLRDLGYEAILQAMDAEQALTQAAQGPDVIVLDISLPGTDGLSLIAPLAEAAPDARILVFSMNDQTGFAARALESGAHGFLSKNAPPADFRDAIRALEAGDFWLSPRQAVALATMRAGGPGAALTARERQVLDMIGRGLNLQAIADDLGVSYKTVANASSALKKKLGVDGMNGLMKIALEGKV
ncbi:MAG: response regulator transcription factor [Paracoccus sp. (in: a-proteobacteria)]|uniref:response regulator transcription factor n=1 Tax=Paracoccus sp. TaxID=267 RepID=UPI0026E05C30|nr:response regulator transcription factor [Paracoccus sp. (in: a-proteobacteria)]MDO5632003.1 response regulator transcription factor [Paracoccus sp. (in: a-proteobacteria)]